MSVCGRHPRSKLNKDRIFCFTPPVIPLDAKGLQAVTPVNPGHHGGTDESSKLDTTLETGSYRKDTTAPQFSVSGRQGSVFNINEL